MGLLPRDCQNGVERDAAYPTASCTVVFDAIGDSKMYLASMDIHKAIDSQMVNEHSSEHIVFYDKVIFLK